MKPTATNFLVGVCAFAIGAFVGQVLTNMKWKPILIEHGAAYYTHDTGEFKIIRKDGGE